MKITSNDISVLTHWRAWLVVWSDSLTVEGAFYRLLTIEPVVVNYRVLGAVASYQYQARIRRGRRESKNLLCKRKNCEFTVFKREKLRGASTFNLAAKAAVHSTSPFTYSMIVARFWL